MAMLNLEPLLALQECDLNRRSLEESLAAVPREVAAVEARIAAERQAIDQAKSEWRELETRKKSLEGDIKGAEEQVARYKSQQLQVRKNDEYQALTHEIESNTSRIGTLEEEEIRVMFSIDEAKKKFAAAESALQANISGHEERIRTLRGREAELKREHAAALEAVRVARQDVPEPQIRIYDRLAVKPGLPVCVAVTGGRCGGCHMKVSSSIEFDARKAENLTTCDQCGRVIFWRL